MTLNINKLLKGLIGKKLKRPMVAHRRKRVWETEFEDTHTTLNDVCISHATLINNRTIGLYFVSGIYLYYLDFSVNDDIEVED